MTTGPYNAEEFYRRVDDWIAATGEVLAVIYHGAGNDIDKKFLTRPDELREFCREAPQYCLVIAFREPQFPLRGTVDDAFVEQALQLVPEGAEAMVLDLELKRPWWSRNPDFKLLLTGNTTDSHAELRHELSDWRGRAVAVGRCPPIWDKDREDIVSIQRRELG